MEHDDQVILNLLAAIEDEPNTTQKNLATRLGVAVGVVNSYLKRVIYKGYVKTKSLQRRRLRYLLTPSGLKEKSRLTYEFLEYSYVYIREMRRKTREALTPFVLQGKKRVVFYGSNEAAELAYLAVRELGMKLVAVLDPERVCERCIDHDIQDFSWFEKKVPFDVLLDLIQPNSNTEPRIQLKKLLKDTDAEYATCTK